MVRHTSRHVPRKWQSETFADVGARLPRFIEDARFIETARLRLLSLFKRGWWGEISLNSSRTSGLTRRV